MDTPDPQSISSSNHLSVAKVPHQPKEISRSARENLSPRTDPSVQDKVTVSDHGREHQAIQELLNDVPEIRQERVNAVRTALESGNYKVSSDLLADRLIHDTLLNQFPPED